MTTLLTPLLIITMIPFFLVMYKLIVVSFSPTQLVFFYFIYLFLGIVLLHLIIFKLDARLAKRGRHLPKTFPKYLEYLYILSLIVSLSQIFVFLPRLTNYVTWLQGGENDIANEIKLVAQLSYQENGCINPRNNQISLDTLNPKSSQSLDLLWPLDTLNPESPDLLWSIQPLDRLNPESPKSLDFWSWSNANVAARIEYCAKLYRIIDAPDVTDYLWKSVVTDSTFFTLNRQAPAFGFGEAPAFGFEDIYVGSPQWNPKYDVVLADRIKRFITVHDFSSLKDSNRSESNGLAWFLMLLLPLGIALRCVKTSVELFVPLQ